MNFQIVKRDRFYEIVDEYGNHRIFGDESSRPYILVNDGERDYRINLLPAMKRKLQEAKEVANGY